MSISSQSQKTNNEVSIHPTAIVSSQATLDTGVVIGPYSVIGPDVKLGKNVKVGNHTVIEGCTFIEEDTQIGHFCAIGGAPQNIHYNDEKTELHIGRNNLIREYSNFHTGTASHDGLTKIGHDNFFMVGCHVAHDCIVGNNNIFANQATLGGHVILEDRVMIGGLTAVHQFARIGRMSIVAGGLGITRDVPPFSMVKGAKYGGALEGVNIIGVQRSGLSDDKVKVLIKAFKKIFFEDEKTLSERVEATLEIYPDNDHIQHLADFLKAPSKLGIAVPVKKNE